MNFANAKAAGFVPQIWANRALMLFRNKIVLARVCRKDTDFGEFSKGESLTIPYYGTLAAQEKTGAQATVQEPTGGSKVTVTLDHHKYVDILVPDLTKAQANPVLMDTYLDPMAEALAVAVEDELFALYAQFTQSVGTSGTDLARSVVTKAREKMNAQNVPTAGRALVISPKDGTGLLGDDKLANYFANQRAEAVSEGSIGRLDGFDIFESNRVPVVAGTPASTKNLAVHPEAMVLATRALEAPPEGSGVTAQSITDTESGLTLRILAQYSMADRGLRVGMDILYGVKKLRDVSGVVVLS
jgi:hypothetical protein